MYHISQTVRAVGGSDWEEQKKKIQQSKWTTSARHWGA